MNMRRGPVWSLLLALVGMALLASRPLKAEPLVADLSNHLIAITTGFTGAQVLLFGATDGPGDDSMKPRPSQFKFGSFHVASQVSGKATPMFGCLRIECSSTRYSTAAV